jgi:hypothetical protein
LGAELIAHAIYRDGVLHQILFPGSEAKSDVHSRHSKSLQIGILLMVKRSKFVFEMQIEMHSNKIKIHCNDARLAAENFSQETG